MNKKKALPSPFLILWAVIMIIVGLSFSGVKTSTDLERKVVINGTTYYNTYKQSYIGYIMDLFGTKTSVDSKMNIVEYHNLSTNKVLVKLDNKHIIFEKVGGYIHYNGRRYNTNELPDETIAWIYWYNNLSREMQKQIIQVPEVLLN